MAWTDDDRDGAIWMVARDRQTCPGCGTREDEWVGADGLPLAEPPYEAKTHRCHGCRELEIAQADAGDRLTKGSRIVLKRRFRGEHA